MNLNDIPENATKFPEGVSEVIYDTRIEMKAFLHGLHYVGDIDVESGDSFERNGQYVVRIRVGEVG